MANPENINYLFGEAGTAPTGGGTGTTTPKVPVKDKLKDADDKVQSGIKTAEGAMKDHKINSSSIVSRAKNSVCQFPVYMSHSIRPNEAHIVSKAFERVYATLVQTVMSQNQQIDPDDVNNLAFLKQFHVNLNESGETVVKVESLTNPFYTPIDNWDEMMESSLETSININSTMAVDFRAVPTKDPNLIKENARLMNAPLTGLSHIMEASNAASPKKTKVSSATVTDSVSDILSDSDLKRIMDSINNRSTNGQSPVTVYKNVAELKEAIKNGATVLDGTDSHAKPVKYINRQGKDVFYTGSVTNKRDVKTDQLKADDVQKAVDAPKLLRDADIKKINGMLPYTIEATFRIRNDKQTADRDIKFIIGIKSVLHLISPDDLSEDIREILSGNNKNLQKVRYKTGEITFADYYFNLSGLKKDANKRLDGNKRWISTLKRLGDWNKTHGTLLKKGADVITDGKTPIPNATLVLTQTDIIRISSDTGIDLSVVGTAKRLAKALFLISVVIVDTTGGTMRVLFTDSDTDWDVQSLSSIEIDTNKSDNTALAKELSRMVNK